MIRKAAVALITKRKVSAYRSSRKLNQLSELVNRVIQKRTASRTPLEVKKKMLMVRTVKTSQTSVQVEEESSGNAGNREQAKKVENVNTN